MDSRKSLAARARNLASYMAFAAISCLSTAQLTDTKSTADEPGQKVARETSRGSGEKSKSDSAVLELTKFEVRTTQGRGYLSPNSANALKTVTPIIDLPNQVIVVTRDLIDDIGYSDTSNVIQYFGGKAGFTGESSMIRGVGIGYSFVDDMPSGLPYDDNFFLDSYVLVKGPMQVLYLNAPLGGAMLKYTRKPLQKQQTTLKARIDSSGSDREEIDTTGPIGKLGDITTSYRLTAMHQGPGNYFRNVEETHLGALGSLEFNFNDTTTMRVTYNMTEIVHQNGGLGFIQPDGKLYTGAGRRVVNAVPDGMENFNSQRLGVTILQKAGSNWDMKFAGSWWGTQRFGTLLNPDGGYNWTTKKATWTASRNDLEYNYYTMMGDLQGHYEFAGMKHQDSMGFAYSDWLVKYKFWSQSTFTPIEIDMADAGAIDKLRPVPNSSWVASANPGRKLSTYLSSIYWQHTANLIEDRLIVVGGVTRGFITTSTIFNPGIKPNMATVVPASAWLHRVGVIAKPFKTVSVYALDSNTFQPAGGSGPILQDGSLAPPQEGSGREYGIKSTLFDGKVTVNFASFKSERTNVLQFAGNLPGTQQAYFTLLGPATQKGFDGDIQVSLDSGLQFLASIYSGYNHDSAGKPVGGSYEKSYSFFTRYDFVNASGKLRGLSIGGGLVRFDEQWLAQGSAIKGYDFSTQQYPDRVKVAPGTSVNVFANYEMDQHWTFRFAIQNLLDETYVTGYQGATYADPSPPRTFQFETRYKF